MKLEIFENKDYTDDLTVRMAHHNTAIEGNTLSQDDTASIILNGIIPRKIDEREFYEVKNYKKIIPFMIENLRNERMCDNEFLKEAHFILLENLVHNPGKFKTTQNMIIGATFETTLPYQVPYVLKDCLDNLNFRLKNTNSDDEKLKAILNYHIKFERIHPFSDGNGRTGRFAMFYLTIQNNLIPFTISKNLKNDYIHCLRNENVDEMFILVKKLQILEQEIISKFECKKDILQTNFNLLSNDGIDELVKNKNDTSAMDAIRAEHKENSDTATDKNCSNKSRKQM